MDQEWRAIIEEEASNLDQWDKEFIRIATLLDRKFYNLHKWIDVFSEAYMYLFKRYSNKGLELPDKDNTENIKMYTFLAKRWILTLARTERYRQKNEVCKSFDETLSLSIKEDNNDNLSQVGEDHYNIFDETNEVQDKLNRLLTSEHESNQQLGMFAKCLTTFSMPGVSRTTIMKSTISVLGIKMRRYYELMDLLKEYLNYRG